jgi:hypothetical protein
MGSILGILLVVGMCYVIYQHFAAPFKKISAAKKQKQFIDDFHEKMNKVKNDDLYKRRKRLMDEALVNKLLTQEEYDELSYRIYSERENDMFPKK